MWPLSVGVRQVVGQNEQGQPEAIKDGSLRSVRVKLIKIEGRLVRHTRTLVFQLTEVAMS